MSDTKIEYKTQRNRNKTMTNKLMYIPNDGKQNYVISKSSLWSSPKNVSMSLTLSCI